jgi:hypothetical protein
VMTGTSETRYETERDLSLVDLPRRCPNSTRRATRICITVVPIADARERERSAVYRASSCEQICRSRAPSRLVDLTRTRAHIVRTVEVGRDRVLCAAWPDGDLWQNAPLPKPVCFKGVDVGGVCARRARSHPGVTAA